MWNTWVNIKKYRICSFTAELPHFRLTLAKFTDVWWLYLKGERKQMGKKQVSVLLVFVCVPVRQASGQCLLPQNAVPWLFLCAHTCMLSPLSVCSLTFGAVKIENTRGEKMQASKNFQGWQKEHLQNSLWWLSESEFWNNNLLPYLFSL